MCDCVQCEYKTIKHGEEERERERETENLRECVRVSECDSMGVC